ncbi:hypothetical protein BT96DRAFT_448892 [Gymnopus androsaceus JB14]|uniref:Uncharacterized protein n=1 Tax=Gymnopus androsaceus JB14 TaxID=1447944 RepID=A0A6A4HZV1_9AGAR|nr:hypothetical protein BT96DRAFT_448892 [Gymnopus androsaceus JB14]
MPMPGSPRANQSPSPRLHPMSLPPDGPPPLPTAPFGSSSPVMGTPVDLGNGRIFVPSSFTASPGPPNRDVGLPDAGPGSGPGVDMPGGYSYTSPGMTSTNQRPVIPDPSLLGPADSDSDSDDRVSSGMTSEANTLTTPPALTRGLPQRGRGGANGRARATGKGKKKR